jgi:D-arabinose 1-dehydrogenase-like Zn-dependent alcohol dehydrogenase
MFEKGLLRGKRILVTGGGSGLGAAMARRFAELGAELIICGRRLELLEVARKSGAVIFEVAKSEMSYTDQRPAEYTAVTLAPHHAHTVMAYSYVLSRVNRYEEAAEVYVYAPLGERIRRRFAFSRHLTKILFLTFCISAGLPF